MRSAGSRFRGSFDARGELITGHRELWMAESEWRPWMDITLTKQALWGERVPGRPPALA